MSEEHNGVVHADRCAEKRLMRKKAMALKGVNVFYGSVHI
jgi:hypothetical protein